MNRVNSNNNSGENAFWTIFGLMVLAGIWLWRLVHGMAATMGVEPRSAAILLLGAAIVLTGWCAVALLELGWKFAVWLGALFPAFLTPAIHDWAQSQPARLGAQYAPFEDPAQAWWGSSWVHGIAFGLIVFVAYLITREPD
ncbi:hypothetical protein RBA41_28700 [Massilia sp. CCM 9210]|uniref:hypothetical protein n=1 Tax=Massilia scottii TaxID=3057166 RepID=UPI0027968B94|nr:hypothetical protein [Massilia sp. CCM 9210]MDQ1817292.1 hypothetical protein [Massilia sp. CCM 9210]